MTVALVEAVMAGAAVDVLSEAFHDYPVMRFVLGAGPDYDRRLRWLVGFSVAARTVRREPILGITDPAGEAVVAAAIVTLPASRESTFSAAARRDSFWQELGPGARARYELYSAAAASIRKPAPCHHLNMIGVRRDHQGHGFARTLIESIHELARGDSGSLGVSLHTEDPKNVRLYEHLGYQLLGHAQVAQGLDTWGMFRPSRP